MAIIAVAGGTGAVGRTLVSAMVGSGRHEVFVLSRTSKGDDHAATPKILQVDYGDADAIASVLRDNAIEVVVSALVLLDEAASQSQLSLIQGAARSGTVTKFIPSEYHLDFHKPVDGIELSFKKFQLRSEQELKLYPHLTWTLVRNGLFLDYLVMPFRPRPSNLMPWCIFVDMQHSLCVLPGDGTHTMTFTHSADVAAYIDCLVTLPASEWPRHCRIAGEKVQLKDLAQIAQRATGRVFKVAFDSAADIQQDKITQLPSNRELFSDPEWGALYRLVEKETMLAVLSNGYDLEGTDLAKICPHIKPMSIEEIFRAACNLPQNP